jgi:hypothetical protein
VRLHFKIVDLGVAHIERFERPPVEQGWDGVVGYGQSAHEAGEMALADLLEVKGWAAPSAEIRLSDMADLADVVLALSDLEDAHESCDKEHPWHDNCGMEHYVIIKYRTEWDALHDPLA